MYHFLFTLLFTIVVLSVGAQTPSTKSSITDSRDSKIYQTIQIGETTWLTENLKYKSENADTLVKDKSGSVLDGYYYLLEETEILCPDGFRIPQIREWEAYVAYLANLKEVPESSIQYSEYENKHGRGRA